MPRRLTATPCGAARVVEGAGHLSLDEGYGPWPAVEHWAREGHFDHAVAGRHAA
ncbi:MAG TPA: hypothetical protein VFY45_13900 [Baekduia sp.]|nr:hypothetical protein [Baekduia sp.]